MPTLITKTTAQRIADEIDSAQQELLNHVQATLTTIYAKVNTAGEQQAILDAFGTNAARALSVYAAIYQTLAALGEADELTAPDYSLFSPQADGTVIFTAPSEPEPSE